MPNYQTGKIYKIVNDVNSIIYVGSTTLMLCQRMVQHRNSYKNKTSRRNSPFYNAMREIGREHFRIILIKEHPCNSKSQLEAEEYMIMKQLKQDGIELYNDFIGCHSEEAKRKIGNASRGNTYCLGKKQTEETKMKRSQSLIGKCAGEKHYNFGKQLSDETKQKLSEARKGEKNHNFKHGCVNKEATRWRFKWSENGKQKHKSFSIKKYGDEEAKRLAEEYRKVIYPEYGEDNDIEIIFLD